VNVTDAQHRSQIDAPSDPVWMTRVSEGDIDRANQLAHEAFGIVPPEAVWIRSGRALIEAGELRAVILVEPSGQFFGGLPVASTLLRIMAVDLPHRGRGLGAWFIRDILRECREAGIALAVHAPRVSSTFRRVGFEFALSGMEFSAPLSATSPHRGLPVEAWDGDLASLAACYSRVASASNGLFDRTDEWWRERILHSSGDAPVYTFVARRGAEIAAYIVYSQERVPGNDPVLYNVVVHDLAWESIAAAQALLGLLRHHLPRGQQLVWRGPRDDALPFILDVVPEVNGIIPWMQRLIDVPVALSQRGYSAALQAVVDLNVSDGIIPENAGSWRISASEGRGSVERIPAARVRVDVGTLAALYTGWLSAREARRLGRLHGANDHDIAHLELLFGGPPAWLAESG
jgi:predicted acetyltransferase